MSVVAICGKPGTGKTLFATYLMKKKFRIENNIIKKIFHKHYYLNVFSNYPIRLNDKFKDLKKFNKKMKKYEKLTLKYPNKNFRIPVLKDNKALYSNSVSLMDLNQFRKYVPDSDFVFDEFQAYFDSLEYKNFPKTLTKVFQFHRHFGIHNIYVISQHPSRIVKQARVLVNEFYNIVKFIKLPFGIGIFRYNIYYNYDDFGKSVNVKKEDVIYDFKKKFCVCRYKRVFNSYDTKYMRSLVDDKPYLRENQFKSINLPLNDIKNNFNITI